MHPKLIYSVRIDLIGDNTVCFFCFKKRRRVRFVAFYLILSGNAKKDTEKADMTFMKSIKKKLNVRELKDDPEYAKYDTDHQIYTRENIFL